MQISGLLAYMFAIFLSQSDFSSQVATTCNGY